MKNLPKQFKRFKKIIIFLIKILIKVIKRIWKILIIAFLFYMLHTGLNYFNENFSLRSPFVNPIVPKSNKLISPLPRGRMGMGLGVEQADAQGLPSYFETPTYINSSPRWKAFVAKAIELAPEMDYPVNVILAQAALESGHGTSGFSHDRYNYFGINAVDSNPDNAYGYVTPGECILEYMRLIKNKYPDAYAARKNPVDMIQAIKNGGYASDERYVEKIMAEPEWSLL